MICSFVCSLLIDLQFYYFVVDCLSLQTPFKFESSNSKNALEACSSIVLKISFLFQTFIKQVQENFIAPHRNIVILWYILCLKNQDFY